MIINWARVTFAMSVLGLCAIWTQTVPNPITGTDMVAFAVFWGFFVLILSLAFETKGNDKE